MKAKETGKKFLKTTLQKLIANISIIAIFVALGIIALCYAGLSFDITIKLAASVAVPSIILCISSLILYELWCKNGINNAKTEDDYIQLVTKYKAAAKHLNTEVMQEFIDAEKERRYQVEHNRLTAEIEKTEATITSLELSLTDATVPKWTQKFTAMRLKYNRKHLKRLNHKRDTIVVDMPYLYAEQFDELQYNSDDYKFKEYKPSDAAKFIRKKRGSKYMWTITLTIVGLNIISISVGGSNWLVAFFLTLIAAISLLFSVITGYTTGYNSVAVYNVGIYETALLFIDKALAYCLKYHKQLYFEVKETDDIPDELKPKVEPGKIDMSIFNLSDKKVE